MEKEIWFYNGQKPDSTELGYLTSNRAFMYGDGFFESMLLKQGKIRHAEDHQQRLLRSAALMELHADTIPLIEEIQNLVLPHLDNTQEINYRIRLSVFRQDEGLYTPLGNTAAWTLQITAMPPTQPQSKGLNIGIYSRQAKARGPFSNIKSISAQLYVMASLYAKEKGLDDVLIMNTSGNLIESSRCNLFLVVNDTILTPPLSEGCIDGIYRHIVIRRADELGYKWREQFISETEVALASEIWLSNAVRGLMYVGSLGDVQYGNSIFGEITKGI